MKILTKNHCMIDLETLSTDSTACVLSIGAVMFRFDTGLAEEFYVNVDAEDCKAHGLHVMKSTVEWWGTQPKHVLKSLFTPKPIPLKNALEQLFSFYKEHKGRHPWSHGAGFDLPIIEHAAMVVGLETPWKYWDELCCRTVMAMLELRNDKIAKSDENAHNALSDAKRQAQVLIDAFKTDDK